MIDWQSLIQKNPWLQVSSHQGEEVAHFVKDATIFDYSKVKPWPKFLGGSDVYAIWAAHYGLRFFWDTPFTIWCKKSGLRIHTSTAATQRGIRREPLLRAAAADIITEHTHQPCKVWASPHGYLHRDAPFLGARLDGLGMHANGDVFGVEIKTSKKDFSQKIPAHYRAQVQHYMQVLGLWVFYLINESPQGISCHRIERAKKSELERIVILTNFWQDHVLSKQAPKPFGLDYIEASYVKLWKESPFGKNP